MRLHGHGVRVRLVRLLQRLVVLLQRHLVVVLPRRRLL